MLDKLPTFVAANVDNILHLAALKRGDLRCFLNKLDNVEKKIDNDFPLITPMRETCVKLLDRLLSASKMGDIFRK